MFLEQEKDSELEELNEDMQKVFDKLNKKSKGTFYESFDWYVERDERGKLHLHVFEIDD